MVEQAKRPSFPVRRWWDSAEYRTAVDDLRNGRRDSLTLKRSLWAWSSGKSVAVPIDKFLQRLVYRRLKPGTKLLVEYRRDSIVVHLPKSLQPRIRKGGGAP